MTENARPKGKLTVYFPGGTGLNVSKTLHEMLKKLNKDFLADIRAVHIDSSDSNLASVEPGTETYLIKGLDGGGKDRSVVYQAFAPKAGEFVEKYQPGDLSLIVTSLGGGTGATVAYVLAQELLSKGHAVMVIGMTNTDSYKELKNTRSSIVSFENVVEEVGKPLILAPFHQDDSTKHEELNTHVAYFITLMACLTSRRNQSLDTKDIYNWLNYHLVTDVKPALMGILHSSGNGPVEYDSDSISPISVATLARPGSSVSPGFIPDYQTVGYISDEQTDIATLPTHIIVADGVIQTIYKNGLDEKLKSLERRAEERQLKGTIGQGLGGKKKGAGGFVA